jgi:hypothetical protein
MNVRILSCGVVGGLLSSYTLSFPLYIILAAYYSRDSYMLDWSWTGSVGYLLTVLAILCTGYTAARWDWQTSPRGRLNAGALAGLLAGMVAFPLIGAPAAAVASQAPVWLLGSRVPFDAREAYSIVVDCVIRAAWFPFLTFWAMVACGLLLGALGGLLAVIDPGAGHWGATPPRRAAASAFDSNVAVMVMGTLILMVCIAAITTLETNAEKSIAQFGLHPGFPTQGITACPIGVTLVMLIVSTWFCGQWCAGRWNHPVAGVQRVARLAGVIMVMLPLFTLGMTAYLRGDIFGQWFFLIGEALWFGVMLYWLVRIKRNPGPEPGETPPPLASLRDRLLINAGFLGIITPALSMAAGVTQAVALALGVVPYIPILGRPNPVTVAATTVACAAGTPELTPYAVAAVVVQGKVFEPPLPAENLPHAGYLILHLYATHVWGACGMAAIWFVGAMIHAGVILTLPAFWKARQAAAAQLSRSMEQQV